MRIGELSSRTGVPVPTIKYYVREGLLPPGELSSPNQASYEDSHERRLRLIRALLEVGGLSVAAIREVITAVDDKDKPVHKLLGTVADQLVPSTGRDESDAETALARTKVARLVADRGWAVNPGCRAGEALASALAALSRTGHGRFEEVLETYADAAERVAAADMAFASRASGREDLVESVAVGTVVGDTMFAALRRLAQEDASARAGATP
ncbi:MerR family transcriptional regulator [Streptomyces sp. NBC_01351]|uniref:MerR family transcriptional regulator n=1 Tax=Streptomyces sp. NBC_01351 TaxID=2903833 RepID=UPI002E35F6D3|nr:MerR family transcriptional regulator [Streptomyces sp. NBC_01351]